MFMKGMDHLCTQSFKTIFGKRMAYISHLTPSIQKADHAMTIPYTRQGAHMKLYHNPYLLICQKEIPL